LTLITALLTGFPVMAQQADCNRACLGKLLDQYLNAIVNNDPDAAPLLIGFRQTENAMVIRQGEGFWQTVTGLGEIQRQYFDPVTGQAAFFGLLKEENHSAIAGLRMKVVDRLITEAEWYVGRQGDPGMNGPVQSDGQGANIFDLETLLSGPPPERTLHPQQRMSRTAMVAIVNSYFDGITTHDGSIILAHPGCQRVENGFRTTGRPLQPGSTDGHEGATDCTSSMGSFNISLVASRRYPVVDVEAGVVVATAVFLRNPGATRRRNSFSEFFVLDSDRISNIWAAMFYPAPDKPVPNWPPYDGNFPLPADFGSTQ